MRTILSPAVRGLFVISLVSAVACGGDEASVADGTTGTAGKAGGAGAGAAAGSGAQAGKAGATSGGAGGTTAGAAGTTSAGAGGTVAGAAGQGTAGTSSAGSAGTGQAGASGAGQAGNTAGGSAGSAAGGSDAGGAAGAAAGGAAGSTSSVSCNIGGPACADGSYCRPKDGTCGVSGTCEIKPTECPLGCSLDGVCGCDGNKYCNACAAAGVGVGIAPDPNSCGPANEACGPLIAKPCGKGTYCAYDDVDACGKSGEGVCKPTPAACPKDLAPVCGCDAKTYANACLASLAGISVAADGPCEKGGVCNTSADCSSQQYCLLGKACGQPGTCADRPTLCTKELAEVCGCDGKTYDNACLARQAGASVDGRTAETDACQPPVSVACGGKGGKACGPTEYCDYPDALCGAADGSGECKVRPKLCPKVLAPVCGCDGKTYDNECLARQAGIDAATSGACSTTKKSCAPGDLIACGKGQYCKFDSVEDACGFQDRGTCEPIPPPCKALCDKPSLCGCDGKFYCAECAAAAAGTSPAPTSVCQGTTPKVCKNNLGCSKLEFCKFTDTDVCGKVSTGVCEARPKTCAPVCNLIGVCACDGKRYCSECDAESAGVSPAPDELCASGPSPF